MNKVIDFLRLALPFAELAYAGALLVNPRAAAEIRVGIDAFRRALEDPSSPVIARGYDGILEFGNKVIGALGSIASSTDISITEKRRQADELVKSLSDPTKVVQARKGKDAELLQRFKLDAAKIAASI